jgi:cell division protein FtsQ
MRDYKNVTVPRKYRTSRSRTSVKRADASRSGKRKKGSAGLKSAVLNILGFALVAGCCWLGWKAYVVITHAELFQIAGVDVSGARRLNDAELKAILNPFTGQNIFRVDLEASARLARANPWIREVRIHRSLPNRISMTLVEREPYAILSTKSGRFLMDREATVIDRAGRETPPAVQLPTIAMSGYHAQAGEPVTGDGIVEALTLLAEIEVRGGWNMADVTIKADSPEALSVVYADHEFKIGSGHYAEKLRRLAEIMTDVKQRGLSIAYVDLRAERQASVMAAGGTTLNTRHPISRNRQ